MANELQQIKTQSLRGFINEIMTEQHEKVKRLFAEIEKNPLDIIRLLSEMHEITCELCILQEIAYRLEYGFITEIGHEDLKMHLVKTPEVDCG